MLSSKFRIHFMKIFSRRKLFKNLSVSMAKKNKFICIILPLLIAITREIYAVKCWRCTSDYRFCGNLLDSSNLTDKQLNWHLVTCGAPRKKLDYKGDKIISKCLLRVDLSYEKLIYTRDCVEESETAAHNSCLTDETVNDDPNVEILACETCKEDGCNTSIKYYSAEENEPSSSLGLITIFIKSKSLMLSMTMIICLNVHILKLI